MTNCTTIVQHLDKFIIPYINYLSDLNTKKRTFFKLSLTNRKTCLIKNVGFI